MPKISQFPAQTGASVANGDLFPIVDVGSPNVSEYITADELAQIPQLTSRYKPLASDRVFIPATTFAAQLGSPVIGTLGNAGSESLRTPAFLLDGTTSELIMGFAQIPLEWNTAHIWLWWSNAGAGSGDVRFAYNFLNVGDAVNTDAINDSGFPAAITAPAQYVSKRSQLTSTPAAVTAGSLLRVMIQRAPSDAGDTLTNDIGVLGVELVRAS